MQQSELQNELNKFKDYVVSQAKSNLTRQRKNSSKTLYNSIKGIAKANPNSFEMEFSMEEYGFYQDKGVKGKDPSKVSPNAKITGQQAPNSPFRFGTGSASGNWNQFTKSIEKWAKRRNVRFRDEKGKYKKGNYKSLSYIIANNIYSRGLKPSLFFTKPFEKAFKSLPDDLVEAFGLDAIKLFNSTTFPKQK